MEMEGAESIAPQLRGGGDPARAICGKANAHPSDLAEV